jgi:anti-anti-sigma factor
MALIESFEDIPSRGPPRPVEQRPEATVVWLVGEHDCSTVAELSATLARAIALDDGDLMADLTGVRFLDASTLRVLLRAQGYLARRGRSLLLRSPGSCARLVLDASGLASLLEPATNPPSALASWVEVPATGAVPSRPSRGEGA